MGRTSTFAAARSLRAVCILAALFTFFIGLTYATNAVLPAQNAITPGVSQNAGASASSAKTAVKPAAKPLWTELSPTQQQALAPLAPEWDKLDAPRKKKWLEIGNRFGAMKPDEQARVQERMREWIKLTPEQRRIARESYARAKKLNPDQKNAQWQQYQQLPEEQKKKLAADAASKKHVANLPAPHSKGKTVAPIKSTPKPVLEQSVTPQAAKQPEPHQPAAPSATK